MPCWYCGIHLRSKGRALRTKDHVVPRSKGGTVTVDCCLACNRRKADLTVEQFRAKCGNIEFWHEKQERIQRGDPAPAKRAPTPLVYNAASGRVMPMTISRAIEQRHKPNPRFFARLKGMRFGLFTVEGHVKGFGEASSTWRVRCRCGSTETRRARAILNPRNGHDACSQCRRQIGRLRTDHWHATGEQITNEESFRRATQARHPQPAVAER